MGNLVEGNQHVTGNLSMDSITLPAGSVSDNAIAADAAISASKLKPAIQKTYSQEGATLAADGTWTIHHVLAADGATVTSFCASCVVACIGAATVSVDLKKGGVSVLTAAIVLNSATDVLTPKYGVVSDDDAVLDDTYTITITGVAGGGTLAKGVACSLQIQEGKAP